MAKERNDPNGLHINRRINLMLVGMIIGAGLGCGSEPPGHEGELLAPIEEGLNDGGISSGGGGIVENSGCNDVDQDGFGSPGDPSCPNGAATDCDDSEKKTYP